MFARFKKRAIKYQNWLLAGGVVILVVGMTVFFDQTPNLDAAAYKPLLNTIAKGESGGNYNAYFGNPANKELRFTNMTIAEVLEWQDNHVKDGNVSNAVGKYQIIKPTLLELIAKLRVDYSEKFDEKLQDRMAIALIERRGSIQYVESKLTREEFATNLAKEWAALPSASGDKPHESYYAGDGINKSNISVDEIFDALDSLKSFANNGS